VSASFTPITTNNQIQGFQWENMDVNQQEENTAQKIMPKPKVSDSTICGEA